MNVELLNEIVKDFDKEGKTEQVFNSLSSTEVFLTTVAIDAASRELGMIFAGKKDYIRFFLVTLLTGCKLLDKRDNLKKTSTSEEEHQHETSE